MARIDIRCDLNLPVEILFNGGNESHQKGNAVNIGLGGAFISTDRVVPEDSVVKLRAQMPDFGSLETKGRVLRKQAQGFALKFLNLDTITKANLWDYISGNLYERASDNGNGERSTTVPPGIMPMHRAEEISFRLKVLDKAVDGFSHKLADIELNYDGESTEIFIRDVSAAINALFDVCRGVETAVGENIELLRRTQLGFRQKTDPYFSKSNLMSHARTWPQGYAGDYKIIEKVYRDTPLSEGVGYLLDKYFLSTELAVAVRERRMAMMDILSRELSDRENPKVLNIGCGSCREIFELAPELQRSGASVTCLDFDSDALNFAAERLSYSGILASIELRKYNALRMVSPERNMKEFGMQDIIYSIGLLDYLEDQVNVRLIGALYKLLKPGGKLIAVFKDAERYGTQDYHWLVDWSMFYQRSARESRNLIEKAEIPASSLRVQRDASGVIIFYIITKE